MSLKTPKTYRNGQASHYLKLRPELLRQMHKLMVRARVLEERLIQIYRQGEGLFWIGGPGEEAFGVALGLLMKKGSGPAYDYLHPHYRCSAILMAMGMSMEDSMRLIMNRSTDPNTGGRNTCSHYCIPAWNVLPVLSPIEIQYSVALGTARVQQRRQTEALTVITGGDAGTAEPDFATCMIWASRPGKELPILMTVQNNNVGISTPYEGQHGENSIVDRGRVFGMQVKSIDGNSVEESYLELREMMESIRKTSHPGLLEACVSRLYGHSSASGANWEGGEDCVARLEDKLKKHHVLTSESIQKRWDDARKEAIQAQERVRKEPEPPPESIWDHIYSNNENADWRKF